ncbi:chaperone protein dnaJ 20, chloroplastic-like [Pistacia vera]|uniref:chaperone protein dnaJ 20, chloroplastic-like n=1 Tax=Pistacia vera TaxID=55513 RepID=UPI0012631F70|nr:chaperone protein dnaJ 20, chloroplastic-like [Pistacia vera]
MSHGIGSAGRKSCLHNCITSTFSTTNSMLQPCSYVAFNSHLPKLSFPLKTQSGSFQNRPRASVVNSLYIGTESLYDLLGISDSGTLTEIKQSYKQLVRKYHPDVSPPERIEEHTKRFIQVQEAYETLSDPISRALYDKQLALSSRKEELEEKREWRKQWQSQLTRLKRRSMRQDSRANMSRGARMRRRSNQN